VRFIAAPEQAAANPHAARNFIDRIPGSTGNIREFRPASAI
jgi:hypothetical protein